MARMGKRVSLMLALLVVVVLIWSLRIATSWGDRTAAALTFATFIVGLLLLVDWLIVSLGPGLWRFVSSVAKSVWRATSNDPEVSALVKRHPRPFAWLGRRLTRQRWSGLYLTVTVLLAAFFTFQFASLAYSLALSRALALYDPQTSALLRAFRTPDLTRLLWVATLAADPKAIPLLVIAVALLLLMWGRRSDAVFLTVVMIAGIVAEEGVKLLFHRQRPPAAFALIKEPGSFSFPSGHALLSLLFAGLLAFITWRVTRKLHIRLGVLIAAIVFSVLVGLSRVYLGVHWMSDVVASWMLALALLSAACGTYLMLIKYGGLRQQWNSMWTLRVRGVASVLVGAALVLVVVAGARSDPLLAKITTAHAPSAWSASVTSTGSVSPSSAQLKELPLFSEKLDGTHQEPISIIFIGTEGQLVSAFRAAGWNVADSPSVSSLARAALDSITNSPYPTAPVTPTFLNGSVQDLAFEKSAGVATVRRRHHARFWLTGKTLSGVPVWVATASFDSRLEIGSAIPLPTHHIDPNLDAEQAYVVRDLTTTGRVALSGRVRVTGPLSGTNAQGDFWFTRGLASVLRALR